ncbi:MAG: hypothetical protein ACI82J_002131, partial [Sulfitobacter litoralis]
MTLPNPHISSSINDKAQTLMGYKSNITRAARLSVAPMM